MEGLYKWISAENLYDKNDPGGPFQTFYSFDPDLEERLTRVEIPVRIYIERGVDPTIEEELESFASEKFGELKDDRTEFV